MMSDTLQDPNDPAVANLHERCRRELSIMGLGEAEMRQLFRDSMEQRAGIQSDLGALKTYCLFIGYPRTGHSLIGSLLDAHPDMVIAHELDVIKFQEAGFERDQIEYLMIENARLFGQAGRVWGPHDYTVPGGWQGRYRTIKVLGDKKGGHTTSQIAQTPQRLGALLELFDRRVKMVHVVRNPFDIITYIHRQWVQKQGGALVDSARRFFTLAQTNARIRQKLGPDAVLDLWHEDLVADPQAVLAQACDHFGVDRIDDHLQSAASIVKPSTRKSREAFNWPSKLVAAVEQNSRKFDFLERYNFQN